MPIPVKVKKNYGPSGLATVKVHAKTLTVTYEDGDVYKFVREDVDVPVVSGELIVNLSRDCDKIFGMRPADGTHIVKFQRFTGNPDNPPQPKDVPAGRGRKRDGGTFPIEAHQEFTALLEISRGKYEGMVIPYRMWYVFIDYEGSGLTGVGGRSTKRAGEVITFLDLAGLDPAKDNLKYSDNVLPALQAMLQEDPPEFQVSLNGNGWIDSLSALPDGI